MRLFTVWQMRWSGFLLLSWFLCTTFFLYDPNSILSKREVEREAVRLETELGMRACVYVFLSGDSEKSDEECDLSVYIDVVHKRGKVVCPSLPSGVLRRIEEESLIPNLRRGRYTDAVVESLRDVEFLLSPSHSENDRKILVCYLIGLAILIFTMFRWYFIQKRKYVEKEKEIAEMLKRRR